MKMFGLTPEDQSQAVRNVFGPIFGGGAAGGGTGGGGQLPPPSQGFPQQIGQQSSPMMPSNAGFMNPQSPQSSLDFSLRKLEEITKNLEKISKSLTGKKSKSLLKSESFSKRKDRIQSRFNITVNPCSSDSSDSSSSSESDDECFQSQELRNILSRALNAAHSKSVRKDLLNALQALDKNPSRVKIIRSKYKC